MTRLTERQAFKALLGQRQTKIRLRELFAADPERFERFSFEAAGLFVDCSRNLIDDAIWNHLLQLAHEVNLPGARRALFTGEVVNATEDRPALHPMLRAAAQDIPPQWRGVITDNLEHMERFVAGVRNGQISGASGQPLRDVVNIGIGGSDLGPRLVCQALAELTDQHIRVHFVANVDGAEWEAVRSRLQPHNTLLLINSKSFSTTETERNARTAMAWLIGQGVDRAAIGQHLAALTGNRQAALAMGVPEARIFPVWDGVGGRYSLWGSNGLAIALYLGMPIFRALLNGARQMDQHFLGASLSVNMPVRLALHEIWYGQVLGAETHAIVPYDQRLELLPAYLQQLDMESNGKGVDTAGNFLPTSSGPVIWGGVGTNVQHAFFQLLHQGTHLVPCDLLLVKHPGHNLAEHHAMLLANALAQGRALMWGRTLTETEAVLAAAGHDRETIRRLAPAMTFSGNRPSTTIMLNTLTPVSLGALLAMYEHKVFCHGVLLGINSFDQMGVELGKIIAKTLLAPLQGAPVPEELDSSTAGLLQRLLD
jgi:glucose-6-phosphate isomerase